MDRFPEQLEMIVESFITDLQQASWNNTSAINIRIVKTISPVKSKYDRWLMSKEKYGKNGNRVESRNLKRS